MSIESILKTRSNNTCELCGATDNLEILKVPPVTIVEADNCVMACATCVEQIEDPETVDPNHWRCLNESMWSEVPAVKVMAWRMLTRLRGEGWPIDMLDMLYLDDDTIAWAKSDGRSDPNNLAPVHRDSNGQELMQGDNVILIKNLDVKGANLIAKRGTSVRRITLVKDNVEQIEGRINGQQIVILTQFVKKSV